ncbi:hypothetical protein ACIBCN_06480 [Nocardia sp. NPDC051052]|uniref:hypothetical protein n=1 Tax=Nocardia sp. NPDC051052 TaxID=3364322 RepID=UPI0037AE1E54
MKATTEARPTLSRNEIRQLVKSFGGLIKILGAADPTDKLEVYRQLGLKMTYNHETRVVVAEVQPPPPVCVLVVSGGDTRAEHTTRPAETLTSPAPRLRPRLCEITILRDLLFVIDRYRVSHRAQAIRHETLMTQDESIERPSKKERADRQRPGEDTKSR